MKKSINKEKLESVREDLKNLNTVVELVLIATMYIEQKAICYLENNLDHPKYIFARDNNLNFNQILRIACACGFLRGCGYSTFYVSLIEDEEPEEVEKCTNAISETVIDWCFRIGSIRNKFAHQLDYTLSVKDKELFDSLNSFYINNEFNDEIEKIRNAISILFCIIE